MYYYYHSSIIPLIIAVGGYAPVPIEYAIRVAQHLGLKSKQCRALYCTARLICDLRKCLATENVQSVLSVLGRVRNLKSCELFAAVAATEIEEAFLQVCGSSVTKELTVALDKALPPLDGEGICTPIFLQLPQNICIDAINILKPIL